MCTTGFRVKHSIYTHVVQDIASFSFWNQQHIFLFTGNPSKFKLDGLPFENGKKKYDINMSIVILQFFFIT